MLAALSPCERFVLVSYDTQSLPVPVAHITAGRRASSSGCMRLHHAEYFTSREFWRIAVCSISSCSIRRAAAALQRFRSAIALWSVKDRGVLYDAQEEALVSSLCFAR